MALDLVKFTESNKLTFLSHYNHIFLWMYYKIVIATAHKPSYPFTVSALSYSATLAL